MYECVRCGKQLDKDTYDMYGGHCLACINTQGLEDEEERIAVENYSGDMVLNNKLDAKGMNVLLGTCKKGIDSARNAIKKEGLSVEGLIDRLGLDESISKEEYNSIHKDVSKIIMEYGIKLHDGAVDIVLTKDYGIKKSGVFLKNVNGIAVFEVE